MNSSAPSFIPNLQILANAGSGKTHHLVTRIVRLLVMGAEPGGIIALTFTRKAAGEFLGKLLQRLAEAARDEATAEALSKATGISRSRGDYLQLLRKVINQLGRLQLTTLDSFFNRVVAAFPQELGLADSPILLDPSAEKLAGSRALRRALNTLPKAELDLLLQSLLERDTSLAPNSATQEIADFRMKLYGEFLDHPEKEAWGNPQRIWGVSGNPWRPLSDAELESHRTTISQEEGSPEFSPKASTAWNALRELHRGVPLNALIKRIPPDLLQWREGKADLVFNRAHFSISPASQQAAVALVEHYLHECTEYRLREARAVYHLLDLYHREYDAEVRGRGMLSFSDVTALLQPGKGEDGMTQQENDAEEKPSGQSENERRRMKHERLRIDERLDARFDHWLLDEFQDTSRSQYQALANILDEVITEAARGGQRSFFCVGDVKQAIYGWRKGEARLFDEIHEHYKGGLDRIPLSTSWRSSPQVLEALNLVFGDLEGSSPGIPAEARERWSRAWNLHQRDPRAGALPGYLLWKTSEGENAAERSDDLTQQVVTLLTEMKPKLETGMTIALLVRSGREATEWLEILREADIPALSESNPPVGRDNPVAAAIRSAFSLMAHPGDDFALHHLSMPPLRGIFFPWKGDRPELGEFLKTSSRLLAEGGFSAVTEWLLERLIPLFSGGDTFSGERAAALRRAALKADGEEITDIDDFLALLDEYEEPGRSAPHAVQVMTVHKAKGLEYDMVVIPFPERAAALDQVRNDRIDLWSVQGESNASVHAEPFLLKLPDQTVRSAPGNEVLAAVNEQKRAEVAFESLCIWYVAMSRAKQGLYLFSPPPDPNEKKSTEECPSFPLLLKQTLAETELGNPLWHEQFSSSPSVPEPPSPPLRIEVTPRATALEKQTPSDEGHESLPGSQAFSERNATALGTAIHAFFESIQWLDGILWKAPDDASPEARELMEACLKSPALRELFTKPQETVQVWREQRFDLLRENRWISGCFDRVVIFRDETGTVSGADLIDFKSDQGSQEELIDSYRPQLLNYREALSQLLHLPEEKIRMILIQIRSDNPVVVVEG